jgi:hypothetical protein
MFSPKDRKLSRIMGHIKTLKLRSFSSLSCWWTHSWSILHYLLLRGTNGYEGSNLHIHHSQILYSHQRCIRQNHKIYEPSYLLFDVRIQALSQSFFWAFQDLKWGRSNHMTRFLLLQFLSPQTIYENLDQWTLLRGWVRLKDLSMMLLILAYFVHHNIR